MLRAIALLFCALGAGAAVASGDGPGAPVPETPVLIVDRRPQSVSLFMTLPAGDLPAIFGTGAEGLLGADGTVDIDRLYEGTFELADRIFRPVGPRSAGRPWRSRRRR